VSKFFAFLQFLSDWYDARAFVQWARQVDAMIIASGPTPDVLNSDVATHPPRRAWLGRYADSWLRRRGLQVFYRGQRKLKRGQDFLSSIASGEKSFQGQTGLDASIRLEKELVQLGISPRRMRATWHSEPVFLPGCPPELVGEPLGGAGIPFSERLPVAAAYTRNRGERIYVTLQRIDNLPPEFGYGYIWEYERIALHKVSRRTVVLCVLSRSAKGF
jgi:hypothetical protein